MTTSSIAGDLACESMVLISAAMKMRVFLKKVEKCYSDMGIEFNQNEIDRAHYIGKPCMDKKKNKV